jgi:hypothetical protein
MSDRQSSARIDLGAALRTLPLQAPERSAWSEIAATLQTPATATRRRGRWSIAVAAAAALAFVALFATHRVQIPNTTVATIAPPAASGVENAANGTKVKNADTTQPVDATLRLVRLQNRSQALERWLDETDRAAAPMGGQDLAAAAEIEDMIGLVDVQLEAAPHDSEVLLWRRRVALLEDLTALRYSSYTLSERGVAANTANTAVRTN